MEYNEKYITEYRYAIKNDIKWKCKLDGRLVWWYKFDIDRENQLINIIKKNKEGEKLYNTYFRYMYPNSKIHFRMTKDLPVIDSQGEGLEIN